MASPPRATQKGIVMDPASSTERCAPLPGSSSHTSIGACYQCGKCTAGCPVASQMESPPARIIRLLQLGNLEAALRSKSIWKCVSCQTCTTRCPKSVDCAGVLDELRQMAVERGMASPDECRTITFQRAFLENIRRNGRLNEMELIAVFKAQVFFRHRSIPFLFESAGLAPELLKRRKLHLRSGKARDRGVVARIFERTSGGTQ